MLELKNGPGIHVIKGTPEHNCRMWHPECFPHPSGPGRRQNLPNPRGRTRSQEQTGLTKRREMQQPTFFFSINVATRPTLDPVVPTHSVIAPQTMRMKSQCNWTHQRDLDLPTFVSLYTICKLHRDGLFEEKRARDAHTRCTPVLEF